MLRPNVRSLMAVAIGTLLACSEEPRGTTGPDLIDAQIQGTDALAPDPPDGAVSPCADLEDGALCDDEDACTLGDTCTGGICVGTTNAPCDAQGPCQPGTCVPSVGCVYQNAEDGTPCSVSCYDSATCQEGSCAADAESAVACPAPDSPCVDQLKCDPITGTCDVEIYKVVDTPCDTDDNVCTLEECDGAGSCQWLDLQEDCAEQNLNNPCWTWTCTSKNGCSQTAFVEGISCDDNNACSANDTCTTNDFGQELCVGSAIPIDDGNPCTDDACVQGVITHEPLDGAVCEATCGGGLCEGTLCIPTETCGCTKDTDCAGIADVCTGVAFCDESANNGAGECGINPDTALVCPEVTAPCGVAICDAGLGSCALANAPAGTPCDDELACIQDGACSGNLCVDGTPTDCDDGDPCTTDTCVPSQGCTHKSSGADGCDGGGDDEGLAAWYRFEEKTGEVLDSSGNGHHGEALGGGLTRGVEGAVGSAIQFTGGDGRVQVPAHVDLDVSTGATLEAWVYLATTNGVGSVMSRGTGNGDQCILMNSSQGNMQTIFQADGGTTNVTSASGEIPVSTWTHVSVTNDGTTLSLYFDGTLNTTADGGLMVPLSSDLFIGRREQGVFSFDGRIDELKWWTVVRSASQICEDAGGSWTGAACDL